MKQYILIIKSSGQNYKPSPEEIQAHIQKYTDWSQKLRDQGLYVTADGLSDEVRILEAPDKPAKTFDSPYTETKEMIGGYFVFKANDFAHAEQIARECPGLQKGEHVELREQMDY